jgi:putative two-component system response regulator
METIQQTGQYEELLTNIEDLVLILEDDVKQLEFLGNIIEQAGYKIKTFTNSIVAWKYLRDLDTNSPELMPTLILSDITMPDMDGYQFCKRVKEIPHVRSIPLLFLSALNETWDKVLAFQVGCVDFITKPYHAEEVLTRVQYQLTNHHLQVQLRMVNQHLNQLVAAQVKEITASTTAMVHAFAAMVENRDNETGRHIERIRHLCESISRWLSLEPKWKTVIDHKFIETIDEASPLHDIGKVGIPDAVLHKPGKLNPEEFEIIKTHTVVGAMTIQKVLKLYPSSSSLAMGLELVRGHHERWDGRGYPDGLAGEAIPLSARIMAIADVYDAMRSVRVYKPAFSHDKTLATMIEEVGHLDPNMMQVICSHAQELSEIWERMADPVE